MVLEPLPAFREPGADRETLPAPVTDASFARKAFLQ